MTVERARELMTSYYNMMLKGGQWKYIGDPVEESNRFVFIVYSEFLKEFGEGAVNKSTEQCSSRAIPPPQTKE